MLDVKRIRNDFDALAEKLATRGVAAETLNELKELDVKRRELLIKSEELKAQRNKGRPRKRVAVNRPKQLFTKNTGLC